jgi:hypothetical protein
MPFPPFQFPARVQFVGGPLCGAWAKWNTDAVIAQVPYLKTTVTYKRTAPDRAEFVPV